MLKQIQKLFLTCCRTNADQQKIDMATVKESMTRIDNHERECSIRYQNIEDRLGEGSKRFDKLELMLWGVYPFIITVLAAFKWMG